MANQFRDYCLTINNPNETDAEFLEYLEKLKVESHLKYAIFQKEIGEKTQTPHFQIYLEFSVSKRFDTIKQYFPRALIEKRRGKKSEAREYCMKEKKEVNSANGETEFATRISESYYEVGEFVNIGLQETVFDSMVADIEAGMDEYEFNQKYRGKSAQYQHFYSKNKDCLCNTNLKMKSEKLK